MIVGARFNCGLSDGLARWRASRAVRGQGKIIADLAAADRGDDALPDPGGFR
jgi:hypothetical protein